MDPLTTEYRKDQLELVTVDGFQFLTRIGSYDKGTIRENLKKKTYLSRISVNKSDIWLDLGGHIGSFSIPIAKKVKAIRIYEPFLGSFGLLGKNLLLNGCTGLNVHTYNAAVVGTKQKTIDFYLNCRGTSHGVHSVVPIRGREVVQVPALCINSELARTKANCLKMDIEGGEHDILVNLSRESWDQLDQLVMEYHYTVLGDGDGTDLNRLLSTLPRGLRVVSLDINSTFPRKTSIVYIKRVGSGRKTTQESTSKTREAKAPSGRETSKRPTVSERRRRDAAIR